MLVLLREKMAGNQLCRLPDNMVNMALDSRSRFPSGFMLQKEDEAGGYASHSFVF